MRQFDPGSIRRLRERYGLNPNQFAKKLKKDRQVIHAWESGKQEPRIGSLVAMMNAFGVTEGYFFAGKLPSMEELRRK